MPRIARVVVPGISHHVTQRGNYQQKVFRNREDRKQYPLWIKEYSNRYGLAFTKRDIRLAEISFS